MQMSIQPIFEVEKNKLPGQLTTVEVSRESMARLTRHF